MQIVAIVLAAAFLLWLICMFIEAYILFVLHLKKRKPDTWARTDCGDTPLQDQMYKQGAQWSRNHASYKKDVHIVNDGLNLYGEYYDFGYDKAALFVPGRTDSLTYSYYFTKPYVDSGYNVLVIDMRAHGWSEGKYNTIGFEEYRDVIKWVELLQEEYHMKSVVIHTLCMGVPSVLYALNSVKCPACVNAVVAEGMYTTFYETFKNHAIHLGYKAFPVVQLMEVWMRLFTGYTIFYGPINVIEQLQIPLLMLHGKQDVFSLPDKAEELYEKCGSSMKELVWFEEGEHSQLRIMNEEGYDKAVKDFLKRVHIYNEEAE